MGLNGISYLILLMLPALLWGQSAETTKGTLPYVTTFPEKITFRVGWQQAANRFYLRNEDGTNFRYRPVNKNQLRLSAQFRALDIGFSFAPAFMNPERNEEGARLFNWNFRVFAGRWMQTFDYYDQKGYFGKVEDFEVYLPNFESRKLGGTTAYVFNPNFSFRALISQNEWQRRSAGSFVPRFVAYYTRYREGLDDGTSVKAHSYDFGLGPGYHYNWVIGRNFLISMGNTTGLGFNILEDDQVTTTSLLWESIFRGALSYNSDRLFFGVDLGYAFLEHRAERKIRLDDRLYTIEVYLGYRIMAPSKWVAKANTINRKFGWE